MLRVLLGAAPHFPHFIQQPCLSGGMGQKEPQGCQHQLWLRATHSQEGIPWLKGNLDACLASLGRRSAVQRAQIAAGMTGVQTEPSSCGEVQKMLFSTPRGKRNMGKPPQRTNPTTEALPDHGSWEMWMQQVSGESQSTNF